MRTSACAIVIAVLSWPAILKAGPWDRAEADFRKNCSSSGSGAMSCTVCGVDAGYSDGKVYWGALKATATTPESQLLALAAKGVQLYCAGSGGTLTATASAAGVQGRTLSTAFRALERRQGSRVRVRNMGGLLEHTKSDAGETSNNIFGITLPAGLSWKRAAVSSLDLDGNVVLGFGDGIQQYGFNVAPTYSRIVRGADEDDVLRVMVGGVLPFQLIGTSGSGMDTGLSWLVGLGAFAGASKRFGRYTVGAGAALDFRYGSGPALPFQLALRGSYELKDPFRLVAQLGIGMELLARSEIADTVRPNLLVGLELGNWVLGYQGFYQSGSISSGFGLSYVGSAGAIATATLLTEAATKQESATSSAATKQTGVAMAAPAGSSPQPAPPKQRPNQSPSPATRPAVLATRRDASASQPLPPQPTPKPTPAASSPPASRPTLATSPAPGPLPTQADSSAPATQPAPSPAEAGRLPARLIVGDLAVDAKLGLAAARQVAQLVEAAAGSTSLSVVDPIAVRGVLAAYRIRRLQALRDMVRVGSAMAAGYCLRGSLAATTRDEVVATLWVHDLKAGWAITESETGPRSRLDELVTAALRRCVQRLKSGPATRP